MKWKGASVQHQRVRLSLQRESGLKYNVCSASRYRETSLPAEGEWIEIHIIGSFRWLVPLSLPAEGEWIEISSHKQYTSCHGGLSLQRESELKYNLYLLLLHCQASHPVKGERIK